jgi:hypothetical protein
MMFESLNSNRTVVARGVGTAIPCRALKMAGAIKYFRKSRRRDMGRLSIQDWSVGSSTVTVGI